MKDHEKLECKDKVRQLTLQSIRAKRKIQNIGVDWRLIREWRMRNATTNHRRKVVSK